MSGPVVVAPLGDAALLVTFAPGDPDAINARVIGLAHDIRARGWHAVTDVVPALDSLAVFFDRAEADATALARQLHQLAAAAARQTPRSASTGRLHTVPVRYDGPDIAEVSARLGIPRAEVVRRHCAREYRVRFLGFAPGFAYLGPLDPVLVLARRAEPRKRVPAGSVAIAGDQTAVYPLETPGGWHLIGCTDLRPFDANRDPPALFLPGDRVRFEPVAA